jgi:hypothetical protein
MAVPEAADRAELSTREIARLLASGMRDELLAIMREMFDRNAYAERLAYSPDEAAELLGISPAAHRPTRLGEGRAPSADRQTSPGRLLVRWPLRQPNSRKCSAPPERESMCPSRVDLGATMFRVAKDLYP